MPYTYAGCTIIVNSFNKIFGSKLWITVKRQLDFEAVTSVVWLWNCKWVAVKCNPKIFVGCFTVKNHNCYYKVCPTLKKVGLG